MRPSLTDQLLTVTTALPTGASAVVSNGIDLSTTPAGDFVAGCEVLITVPAVTTGQLADAATHKFDIVTGTSINGSGVIQSPTTVAATVLTQTGAGGVGSAQVSARFNPASNIQRYIGVRCTKSDAHDASAVSFTVQIVF